MTSLDNSLVTASAQILSIKQINPNDVFKVTMTMFPQQGHVGETAKCVNQVIRQENYNKTCWHFGSTVLKVKACVPATAVVIQHFFSIFLWISNNVASLLAVAGRVNKSNTAELICCNRRRESFFDLSPLTLTLGVKRILSPCFSFLSLFINQKARKQITVPRNNSLSVRCASAGFTSPGLKHRPALCQTLGIWPPFDLVSRGERLHEVYKSENGIMAKSIGINFRRNKWICVKRQEKPRQLMIAFVSGRSGRCMSNLRN